MPTTAPASAVPASSTVSAAGCISAMNRRCQSGQSRDPPETRHDRQEGLVGTVGIGARLDAQFGGAGRHHDVDDAVARRGNRVGKCRERRVHGRYSSRSRASSSVSGPCGVARHLLGAQERRDASGLVEGLVAEEAQVGREFQVHAPRHLLAQRLPVAIERRDHRRLVPAAERHHVGGGELQVRRHAHLGDGDDVRAEHRVLEVAAREHLGERVTNEFGDALLALRGTGVRSKRLAISSVSGMRTGHCAARREHGRRHVGERIATPQTAAGRARA